MDKRSMWLCAAGMGLMTAKMGQDTYSWSRLWMSHEVAIMRRYYREVGARAALKSMEVYSGRNVERGRLGESP